MKIKFIIIKIEDENIDKLFINCETKCIIGNNSIGSKGIYKIIIPNSNIDTNSIRVFVNTNIIQEYKQYANIFQVNPDSKIFLIQEILNEQYQILFGDNI